EESSILQFRALQMNTGSWDGWIYGEDDRYYYYAGNHDYDAVYVMFPKKKIKECDGFDPINFSTWCKEYVLMPSKKSFIGK
ncbi:MAG: hypothetical protein RML49_08410, partial [Verrucomicrobiae bacterium]|nr:hypothetical protein [Verrucomicrobiae bacterium]